MKRNKCLFLTLWLFITPGLALADESGLNADAMSELQAAGVDKYLGTSQSFPSDYGVWTRHDFDPNYVLDPTYPVGVRPDGPVCIAGTPYSVFTRQGDPKKLLIFLQGGGACWQSRVSSTPPWRTTRSRTTPSSTCPIATVRRSAVTTT
jgi:hypothetical protein